VDFGPIEHLPRVLNETFLLSGGYSQFRGRRWGRPVEGLPGERFVVGIQNHDHIGNRAAGERLGALVTPAVQRLAASFMLLSPFTPLLFMGEEYGEDRPFLFFCSFGDRGLIENVRQGRKRDYGLVGNVPDPQAKGSFFSSKLSWSWPEGSPRAGLRNLYHDLLEARRTWPALRDTLHRAAQFVKNDSPTKVVQLVRGGTEVHDTGCIVAYFNFGDAVEALPPLVDKRRLFTSEDARYVGSGTTPGQIGPYECVVFGPAS
jgi:maltooligosyltrehalose trehalohydrolase